MAPLTFDREKKQQVFFEQLKKKFGPSQSEKKFPKKPRKTEKMSRKDKFGRKVVLRSAVVVVVVAVVVQQVAAVEMLGSWM